MTRRADAARACRRWGAGFVAAALLWGGFTTGSFYVRHWSAVTHLPTRVETFVRRHHGHWVSLAAVSPWFTEALVATEDRTFYTNLGISVRGIARSLWVDLSTGQFTEGGSTLTQQLVRDQLLSPEKTLRRKLAEALLSVLVTALYPKSVILTLYVNQVDLGHGFYGVDRASWGYFGRPPARLTLNQAALLAGLPQDPAALDPLRHLRAARARERVVLDSLVALHLVSPARAEAAWRSPLGLVRP
ncbi:MAG: transglycosylase domain-containing protein [Actinomycetia bacterium]|nr:transglycosylase domain-containing protein [Actinomycetes bacterium]